MKNLMSTRNFGVEVEFTGITRAEASKVAAKLLKGRVEHTGDHYDTYNVIAEDQRVWKFMSDASLRCEKKEDGRIRSASNYYSVELVTPILTYQHDIETLQSLVRALRKAGGFVNDSMGIHVHLDGAEHTAQSIMNFVNIIASKNDLLYTALKVPTARMRYCKKIDQYMVTKMNKLKRPSLKNLEDIWYEGYSYRTNHYNDTRYCFLNLHSFFHCTKTVELRGFNSTLHAGELRSYIVLALALNEQALNQKFAHPKKPQVENQRFAMRTYLNRIGLVGDEFKACRAHLTKNLNGSSAWRHRA